MSEFVDYYLLLQLDPCADADAIKWQYRRMAHKHHPDHGGDVEVMKRLTEAYYTLSDTARREAYDQLYQAEMQRRQGMTSAPVPQMVDIPDEVVDAIMAAMLAEMAAATVRTAGRAVVATGVTAVNAVANTVANTVDRVAEQRRLERKQKEDEVWRYLDSVRKRVDAHVATKRLTLSSSARSWLGDSVVSRDAGRAQPPLPRDGISALDVWQLMEQTLVPSAATEARLQAVTRPEYVTAGHCRKCDRTVRWTSNFRCARCSQPVNGPRVATAGSAPAMEALYEQPETTRERVQRLATAFGIIAVLLTLGYVATQSG